MPYAPLFLIISLLLFLLFTETVTVRCVYDGKSHIDIDFMLFGISLSASAKRERRAKRKLGKKKARKVSMAPLYHLPSFLRRARVDINGISLLLPSDEPHKQALRRAAFYSFVSSAYAYFENYAKKFTASDIIIGISDNNKTVIRADISTETSLLNFAVCLFLYLFQAKRKGAG